MKKIFVVLLVCLVAVAAFGEKGGTSLGVTYIMSSQQYTTGLGATQDITLSGIGLNDNILSSAPWGFAMDMTIAFLLAGSVDGSALDMSLYDIKVMLDMMMGVGYQAPIGPGVLLTLGLGPHINAGLLVGSSTMVNNGFAVGVAATAKVEYMFSRVFGVYLGAKGSFDFLSIDYGQSTTFKNGFVLAGSAGVSLHIY